MSTRKSKSEEAPKFETAWDRRGPCGYSGCGARGLVRQYTATGWINLCALHYEEWHNDHYVPWARRINNEESARAVREAYQAKLAVNLPIPASREPGAD